MPRFNKKEKEYLLGIEPKYLLSEPDWKNTKNTDLPDGYKRVQYIEGSSAFIKFDSNNLLITWDQVLEINAIFQGGGLFIQDTDAKSLSITSIENNGNPYIYARIGNDVYDFDGEDGINSPFRFKWDKSTNTCTINSQSQQIGDVTSTGSIYLLYKHNTGLKIIELSITTIYGTYNFTPCVSNDNNTGLWVKEESIFIGATQGYFIPGPEI